ncbi:ester cyclase [Salipiger sp. H15]|uniref:Ester cyclase n=1 Tax=Alloyangia sp. H15 TaxID=3029062 RepID=A0AAU8AIC0_9RHOB
MPFLAGFDARWPDVGSYLAALIQDLDEARRLDLFAEHLSPEVVSHDGLGALAEPEVLGAELAARAAALTGARLLTEERIWQATAQNAFVAAERFHVTARHDGAGLYGPPTRRKLRFTQMSERYCVAGQLREQWVLRDEAAILAQIGVDVMQGARWRLADAPRAGFEPRPAGPGNGSPWGAALAGLLARVMDGELAAVAQYDPAAELVLPGGETGCGPRDAETFWLGLRAAFPSARFEIDHALGAEEPLTAPRACLRWSLTGNHDGHGAFGTPTGAPVRILGMTQAEFGPDGLRREWTLYDVPGVWAQILRAAGG